MSDPLPTVGRNVHYWCGPYHTGDQPYHANVAHVNEDGTINVGFLYHTGMHGNDQNVPYWNGKDPKPARSYWQWMPYQLGQAKKTEEAEAKLAATAP